GESLVTSKDIPAQMRSLLRGANEDIQVKICGLRTPEHVRAASDAGADMLGLMFYEPSPRYVEPQQARALLESVENSTLIGTDDGVSQNTPDIRRGRFIEPNADLSAPAGRAPLSHPGRMILPDIVGVFVNKGAEYINEVAQQVGLHAVQL